MGIHFIVSQTQETAINIIVTGKANIVYVKNDNPTLGYFSSKKPFNNMFGAVPTSDPKPPSVDE